MKIASLIFGLLAAVLLLSSPAVENYYGRTRPHQPDQQSGQIHEINVHGTVVFLDRSEYLSKLGVFYGGVLSVIICGLLWRAADKKNKKL